jgi:hypothetical protein
MSLVSNSPASVSNTPHDEELNDANSTRNDSNHQGPLRNSL